MAVIFNGAPMGDVASSRKIQGGGRTIAISSLTLVLSPTHPTHTPLPHTHAVFFSCLQFFSFRFPEFVSQVQETAGRQKAAGGSATGQGPRRSIRRAVYAVFRPDAAPP